MVLSVGRTLPGQFDLVGSFQMVDLSDGFLVRRDDVHMFPDLCGISHVSFSSNGWGYETRCFAERLLSRVCRQAQEPLGIAARHQRHVLPADVLDAAEEADRVRL